MVNELTKIWEKNVDKRAAKIRAERVLKEIRKYHKNVKNVLELGVGLGVVLSHFKNFEKSGLDLRKDYIHIARKKIPNAKLYIQSMHNFKINEKFDVIFSVHECINEVKPYKNWESTFKHVYNNLSENGLFAFDMRTSKHLDDMKKQPVILKQTPTGYVYDNTIVKGDMLTWDTTYFKLIKGNIYKVEKDRYNEIVHSVDKVKRGLSKYFKIINIVFFEDKRKCLFVCRKK